MNKKVGLVTYYGNNYGGCLQAYAIQTTIKGLGFDPRIIQVDTPLKDATINNVGLIQYGI